MKRWIAGLGLVWAMAGMPAQAQAAEPQVDAMVEALRLAAPNTGREDDGLYSDWQIKPENIPRWSRRCIGRELSPTEFAASPATARTVLACVMEDVLQDEYGNSNNDEAIAVRRAAAWWMTGDADRYNSPETAAYTERVLGYYEQQVGTSPSVSASPSAAPVLSTPVFDRYMQAGYSATQQRDYPTALLYFRRALDERPGDPYAQQAIENVEGYLARPSESESSGDRP